MALLKSLPFVNSGTTMDPIDSWFTTSPFGPWQDVCDSCGSKTCGDLCYCNNPDGPAPGKCGADYNDPGRPLCYSDAIGLPPIPCTTTDNLPPIGWLFSY